MNKAAFRKIYLARQKSLTDEERREKCVRISERFFSDFDISDVRFLHLFLSIRTKGELDTSHFINELWDNHVNSKTIVPRVDFENDQLKHLEFNSESRLAISDWGIPEPVGAEMIDEKKIDLVLVPMLCFDKRGFRVGHGKGYYDKFLIKCREDCLKIGLSMFDPVEEIEDVEAHDVKLDYCITPEKVWKF